MSGFCDRCVFSSIARCVSLVQKSPIECGVSEYDREASIMRRPWPVGGVLCHGGKNTNALSLIVYCIFTLLERRDQGAHTGFNDLQCGYVTLSLFK